MYDWPCVESNLQHYPPDVVLGNVDEKKYCGPFWEAASPITAKELARQHLIWFQNEKKILGGKIFECYDSSASSVQEYVKNFISWARLGVFRSSFSGKICLRSTVRTVKADVLIFATGMGAEKCEVECKGGV